jgi:hypothetical protein
MLRFEDLRVRDNQNLDRDFFNRRYRLIAESLVSLGTEVEKINSGTDSLINLGLARLNEVLGPALATAQSAAENGFLVATSETRIQISQDFETTFEIKDGPERQLFAPTPAVILMAADGTVDDWALFEVDEYNRENGGLAGKVIAVSGAISDSPIENWVISASAGLGGSILSAAAQITETLALAERAATEAAEAAEIAENVLATGPVSSVNGKTGEVLLGVGDIPNLTALVAAKADASHGHEISNVSGLSAALDGLTQSLTTSVQTLSAHTAKITALETLVGTNRTNIAAFANAIQTLDGGAF